MSLTFWYPGVVITFNLPPRVTYPNYPGHHIFLHSRNHRVGVSSAAVVCWTIASKDCFPIFFYVCIHIIFYYVADAIEHTYHSEAINTTA